MVAQTPKVSTSAAGSHERRRGPRCVSLYLCLANAFSASSAPNVPAAHARAFAAVGDELKQAIKRQVEFYFSKSNLATDAFLVSNMNSQMYVAGGLAAVEHGTDAHAPSTGWVEAGSCPWT